MVVRGCFPQILCFQRFQVLCVSCFFPFVSLIYGYGMLWLWIIVHHWGDSMAFDPSRFSREISYRLLVKKQHVRPMPMWSCVPSLWDEEQVVFLSWVFRSRRFPKNGGSPKSFKSDHLVETHGFRDSPMFRTPPYEWDDELICHGLRYIW